MRLYETVRWIVLAVLFVFMYYAVSVFTMKRNIVKVIKIFDEKKALSAKTAVSNDILGIKKQGIFERALKRRDNRIHALQFLINAELVMMTSDGRLYLKKGKMDSYRERGNLIARIIIPSLDK